MKRATCLLILSLALLLLTAGCFQIDQELWHNADGSGKASFNVSVSDQFLQLASGGQVLPHLFETWNGLEAVENSNYANIALDEALNGDDHRYSATVDFKDFSRLAELQRETLDFRIEEQENGNLRFTQVLDYRLDTSEPGAAETMELLVTELGDDAYTVRLHVPNLLTSDSRGILDAKAGVVEWKIPMSELFSAQQPVEIWAEYRLSRGLPWWVWVVTAAVLLIGAGVIWFLRWPRTMPGGVELPQFGEPVVEDALETPNI